MGRAIWDRIRAFRDDAEGSVTVEFVVTLPILLAALGFAAEYGEAMKTRNAMDSAARDAARFISRAPIDESTGTVPDRFLCDARNIITWRLEVPDYSLDDALTSQGCNGYYTDSSGDLAVDSEGNALTDAITIDTSSTGTTVSIRAFSEFGLARMFGWQKSAEDGGSLSQFDGRWGIYMSVTETWGRSE
ncbi:pilus assembly protein [Roseobacter sp. HKCCA0434]|uniref:TadE/TadG family type IV pilus assembly protein n=1 Tax=Roseobacter sp. HKCCA0434 TaxID=3079297 RepID=UPI002905D576|nr:pilus assembly protein [Roseobacter sp. HKCCA0434]